MSKPSHNSPFFTTFISFFSLFFVILLLQCLHFTASPSTSVLFHFFSLLIPYLPLCSYSPYVCMRTWVCMCVCACVHMCVYSSLSSLCGGCHRLRAVMCVIRFKVWSWTQPHSTGALFMFSRYSKNKEQVQWLTLTKAGGRLKYFSFFFCFCDTLLTDMDILFFPSLLSFRISLFPSISSFLHFFLYQVNLVNPICFTPLTSQGLFRLLLFGLKAFYNST